MSVEALLSEVSPTLPLTQVIKSAEQLYFKEHLLHTNVVPEYHAGSSPGTSGQGQDKTSKKDKKGKGTGGHDDEDSQNPLSAAINAVKNTVSSVLGVGSQGSVSNAEVDELRKAVDTLKLDNESLRKEVSELRKLVEKASCVECFDVAEFVRNGYQCAGYLSRDQRFHNDFAAIRIVFTHNPSTTRTLKALRSEPQAAEGFHPFRPYFMHDISILFADSWNIADAEKSLFALIRQLCGQLVVSIAEIASLRSVCPKTKLRNRIYRLAWQGVEVALSRRVCNALQEELREALCYHFATEDTGLVLGGDKSTTKAAAPAKKETEAAAGGDDDFDLFGSDEEEESEEAKQVREKRLADYAAKKAKKPGPIAKSNIIYDVKPWDDTIDVKDIETKVREIEKDGLVWGASKILPVAFGIKKLQICCVVEDEKVSSDWLEEQITDIEDLVQSVDVVAFNKV